jgi:hypothetical protein
MNRLSASRSGSTPYKGLTTELRSFIPANPAALQFCWHIRVGMAREIDHRKIKTYADFFYKTYLNPHLCAQEQLILSCEEIPYPVKKKVMASHRKLRRLFEDRDKRPMTLSRMEDTLEQHVLLEQRVLFKELYTAFKNKGCETSALGRQFYNPSLADKLKSWHDRYWSLD